MLLEYFAKKNIAGVHRMKISKFSSWEICAQKLQYTSAGMLDTLTYKVEMTADWEKDFFSEIWIVIQVMEVLYVSSD